MPLLFVYGTLRSDSRNRWARLLRSSAVLLGEARVRGTLYTMGRYPALRLSRRGWVHGELYRVLDERVLAALDAYEGRQYRRLPCTAERGSRRVLAQTYVWQWRLPEWRKVLRWPPVGPQHGSIADSVPVSQKIRRESKVQIPPG